MNIVKFLYSRISSRYEEWSHQRYYDRLSKYMQSKGRRTSMSDDDAYPALCYAASVDDCYFRDFRRNFIYNRILEHVTQELGQEYLDVILRRERPKFSRREWDEFCKNDLYGNPRKFPYEIKGDGHTRKVSPTTLRYIKVLQDIMMLFDTKQIETAAEIGVGYGGECRILTSCLTGIRKYYLFDLPEVLGLAEKYLAKFPGHAEIVPVDGTKIEVEEDGGYDLVISNYAFSELARELQDIYLEKVILRARAGYITWNTLSYDVMDGYSVEELLDKIPGSYVVEGEPFTHDKNCIILFSNKQEG